MKIREFRAEAREALCGNWLVAVVAGIVFSLFTNFSVALDLNAEEYTNAILAAGLSTEQILSVSGVVLAVALLNIILVSLVTVGYAQFNIDLIDGERPRIITLFTKWRQIGKAIVASLLVTLRVFLGMILFLIPGIIAAYSHAMVYHILAENPDMTVREAMAESRRIMKGNKFRFFCLQFSFIGWNLLVLITFGIAGLWVMPYEQAAIASFYREIA